MHRSVSLQPLLTRVSAHSYMYGKITMLGVTAGQVLSRTPGGADHLSSYVGLLKIQMLQCIRLQSAYKLLQLIDIS